MVHKVLPNENYTAHQLNTNKNRIIHRNRLTKLVPKQPLEDNYREETLQPDEEITISQDDVYIKTWDTAFGDQLETRGNEPFPTNLLNAEQPVTSNNEPNAVGENEVDYITGRDSLDDVNDAAQTGSERLFDDVNKSNEAHENVRNENSDWPDSAIYHKNYEKTLPDSSERQENDANLTEENSSNTSDAQHSPKRGMISCPKHPKNDGQE